MRLQQIEIQGQHGNWSVKVDGHEIANRISGADGLHVDLSPNTVPVVKVGLTCTLVARYTGLVIVNDEDRDALIALGWTPPEPVMP